MADLWPYSGRNNGRVTDREHELLWGVIGDGILPGENANALSVNVTGDTWSVQPGKILITGHVLDIPETVTGSVPSPGGSPRTCLVVAHINHSQTPWTYGVELVPGTPGGGRPAISRNVQGRYQVPLRAFVVDPDRTVTPRWDERPMLDRRHSVTMPEVAEGESSANYEMPWDAWGYGSGRCSTAFFAPPSGEVMVTVYARCDTVDNTASAIMSWEIRKDDAQGAVVRGPWQDDGLTNRAASAGGSSTVYVVGLDPYRRYYIATMNRLTNSTTSARVRHRRITVVPIR